MNDRFPTKAGMIRYFFRGSTHWFILSAVFTALVSFFKMVIPKVVSFTVDSLISNTTGESFVVTAALFVGAAALLRFLFRFLFSTCSARAAENFSKKMRDELFGHILYLPFAWLGDNKTGDLIQRCTSDIETVKRFVSEQLTMMLRDVIMILMAIGFMSSIDWRITLMSVSFIPLIVGFSYFFYSRIGNAFDETARHESALSAAVQENLAGARVIRAYAREHFEKDRFRERIEEYTQRRLRLQRLISAFSALGNCLTGLQTLAVVLLGAVCAARRILSTGDYIALISYSIMLAGPERGLGRLLAEMSRAGISVDRLCYIMNAAPEKDRDDVLTPPMDRDIVFDHISYTYGDRSEVLQDVSFTVPAGSVLGILGGTGSGKSTLMYLLTRLYELPEENGKITIGGIDIADIRLRYLRKNIGIVLQDTFLFSKTLSENIGISEKTGDMEQIRDAAKTAGIDDTIGQFDEGYDTFVGERGAAVSGGQRQRTAIAQMLIRRPPVMIFDDSLSCVDAETDAKIRCRLQENKGSSTVILIAHRIATLMQADHIIVLDHGRICEEGTHQQLLDANGLYRQVFDLQTGGTR